MASEIRVDKINSLSGVGTVTLSPTGVDISGITTVSTLKVGTGVTASEDGDIFFTGIATATTFVGNLTGDPTGSGANLTALPAGQLTGTVADARISTLTASKLSGALPAISALNLTNVPAANVVGVHTSLNITGSTTTGTAVVGGGVTISESGIEASGIGITCASINGTQIGGRRNIIINGAMMVAQRGTSSTTSGYGSVDRFQVTYGGTDEAPTHAQVDVASGTSPYAEGFKKSLKVTNGNQTSGVVSGSHVHISHRIESQNTANSGWNYTSTSSFITLSFWVKSSVAQEFHGFLLSADGTRKLYSFSLGSLSANTWTKVIKTIPGTSDLQFDNNNEQGILFRVAMFRGTTYTGTITQNQWGTFNTNVRYPNYTSTWYTTNDATFEMTGVQLEVGSQATAFEHRSFGEELALCQRYYEHSYNYGTYPGANTDNGTVMFLSNRNTGTPHTMLRYVVPKRSAPTVTAYTHQGNAGMRNLDAGVDYSGYTFNRNGQMGCTAYPTATPVIGQFIQFHYTAVSEL